MIASDSRTANINNSESKNQENDDSDNFIINNNSRTTQQNDIKTSCHQQRNQIENSQKTYKKREMANERERERTRSINKALDILRNRLPVAESEKRSKIQTLKTARWYICFLSEQLLSQRQQVSMQHQNYQDTTIKLAMKVPISAQTTSNFQPAQTLEAQPSTLSTSSNQTNSQQQSAQIDQHCDQIASKSKLNKHIEVIVESNETRSKVPSLLQSAQNNICNHRSKHGQQSSESTLAYNFYKFRLERQVTVDH